MATWYSKLMEHKDWGTFLPELNKRKMSLRTKAETDAAKLGHRLEGWSPYNSCYCRKCGAYARIDDVYCPTNSTNKFFGSAFLNKCIKFEGDENFQFDEYKNPHNPHAVF